MVDVNLGDNLFDGLGLVGLLIVIRVENLIDRNLIFITGDVVDPFEFFKADLFLMNNFLSKLLVANNRIDHDFIHIPHAESMLDIVLF